MALHLDLLKDQLNVKDVLFSKNLKGEPIKLKANVQFDQVGPRVKGDMSLLLREVEKMDAFELREQARLGNSISVTTGQRKHKIDPSELSFSSEPEDGYAIIEKDDLVCLLNVQRDRILISEGLARDLARRLQSLRKEQGFNPTEILARALVAGLDEEMLDLLSNQRSVLSQLVRVKEVVFVQREAVSDKSWNQIELDGHVLECLVE
jgi:isoleucyl-tRNA synthetase